jgi:hypothetical protein
MSQPSTGRRLPPTPMVSVESCRRCPRRRARRWSRDPAAGGGFAPARAETIDSTATKYSSTDSHSYTRSMTVGRAVDLTAPGARIVCRFRTLRCLDYNPGVSRPPDDDPSRGGCARDRLGRGDACRRCAGRSQFVGSIFHRWTALSTQTAAAHRQPRVRRRADGGHAASVESRVVPYQPRVAHYCGSNDLDAGETRRRSSVESGSSLHEDRAWTSGSCLSR